MRGQSGSFACRRDESEPSHGCAATRTGELVVGCSGGGIVRRIGFEEGDAGVEGDALAAFAGGGMVEAVVADGAQSARGDVAQVACDKLVGGQAEGAFGVAAGAIGPGEGGGVVIKAHDAGVADGGAADVASEVAHDAGAVAEGADVNAPVVLPEGVIFGGCRGQVAAELSHEVAESGAQDRLGDEEAGSFDGDDAAVGGLAGSGDDGVDMRMELQALIPGVQDHGEAAVVGAQPALVGEDLAQGSRGGLEEGAVGVGFAGAGEERTQRLREGEGDHEVGSVDSPGELAAHPLCGVGAAAQRTAAVMAGVVKEAPYRAIGTLVEVAAHRGCAAMQDGPGRPSLRRRQHGATQVLGKKAAQEPGECPPGHRMPEAGRLLSAAGSR